MSALFLLCFAFAAEPAAEPVAEPVAAPTPYELWQVRNPVLYMASHRMEAGETAWALSQAVNVPVPVLRALSTLDLDRLHVGDWLSFPVTEGNEQAAGVWLTVEECGC
jgi:hypothetical protein